MGRRLTCGDCSRHWRPMVGLLSFFCVGGQLGALFVELLEDSTQLQGLAELGMAPRCLARRNPRWMTPSRYRAASCLTCLLAGWTSIITIDNFFSAGQGILEFLACLKLRLSHPDLPRLPRTSGTWGLLALLVIPVLISAYVSDDLL